MKDFHGSATNTVDILKSSSAFPEMQLFAIFYNFKQSQRWGGGGRPFHCVYVFQSSITNTNTKNLLF